jgi:hypothetical protein
MSNDGGVTHVQAASETIAELEKSGKVLLSVKAVLPGWRLFDIHVGSNPIMRCRRVALAGHILCEKHVTRTESHPGPVAEPDSDSTRESDDPSPSGSAMPINNMGRKVISKEKSVGWARRVEKLR